MGVGDAVGVFVGVDDEVVFEALAAFVGAVCGFEGVAEGCFVALWGACCVVEDADALDVGRGVAFEFFDAEAVQLVGEGAHALSAFTVGFGLKDQVCPGFCGCGGFVGGCGECAELFEHRFEVFQLVDPERVAVPAVGVGVGAAVEGVAHESVCEGFVAVEQLGEAVLDAFEQFHGAVGLGGVAVAVDGIDGPDQLGLAVCGVDSDPAWCGM